MADLTDKPKDQKEVDLVGLEQLKQESPDVLSEPAFPIVTNLPERQPTAEVVDFPIVTDFPKASPFSDGGLRFSADRAKGVDPVQHAEDVELSRQTGLPVETVSKNRGAIFERMSAPDLDKIEKDSPVLSRGLSNPDFAIFSKKSLPALEAIERRYKAQKERTFTQVTLDDLKRGTVRLGATGEALGYQLDNLISKMGQGFLPKPRHISEEDWERQRLRSIPVGGLLKAREAEEAIPQNPKIEEFTQIVEATQQEKGTASAVWEATKYLATNPTLFAGLLAEQVAPMAATLPLGGPVIGSAVNPVVSRIANEALRKYVATSVKLSAIQGSSVMVQMYGSEINEGLSKGLSVEDALDRAAKKTMVEAGVNMLAGPIPGAGKNPVLLALQETAKQGVLGATGAAAGSAAVGEQISLSEFLLEGFGELTTAPIDLAVASFEMTSSGRQDARRGVDLGPDIVPLEVEEAFESIHAQTELTEMIAMVQSADVTSLSPASMKEYIDELANEYEHNNVLYIDADNPEVAGVLNAMEDSPISGELKKQFAEGGDIVIPLSDYLTEVAISDYGNNLRNHVRITEDGLTLAELQDFSEDTEKKIENVLTRVVKSIDDVVLEEEDQTKLDAFKESVFTSLIATERMDQRIAKANTEVLASRIPTIMADYSLSFDEAVERLGFGGVVASEPPKSGEVVTMAQEQGYEGADPVDASEWSQAIAKFGPEGMTREARMARAEEMGYDTSQVYYHGSSVGGYNTTVDIGAFSFESAGDKWGQDFNTFSFTTNPKEAEYYATTDSLGARVDEGATYQVFLKSKNPLVIDSANDPDLASEQGVGYWDNRHEELIKLANEGGHDSIQLIDRGAYDDQKDVHVLILDPSNIRSINAAFDPDFAASPNLLAQEYATTYRQKQKKIQAFFLPEKRVIGLTKHSNPSSFVHEVGHLFLEIEKELAEEFGTTPRQQEMLSWLGVEGFGEIGKDQHEQFARGFEAYLYEGKAPSVELASVFARFRAWMITIYKNIRNLDVSLTPEVRDFFDHLLATDEQISRVRNNPEYDQFFMSKEAAGMTEEEWRAHQESRQKSKDKATQTLEEKVLKRLQRFYTKEWKEEEAKVKQEAADMLLETDLYRASAFIRGDLIIDGQKGQLNKAQVFDVLDLNADPVFADQVVPQIDSLLVAIARLGGLNRELAQREGVDPDNWRGRNSRTINQPVFGKPIFKIDGLDFDAMRERLYDEGYRYESASDLVDAVQLELSGTEVHSVFYDPDFERKKAKPLPRNLWGTTAKNGLDAEEVAARFGFVSAYDMLNKIAKAPLLHQRATAVAREHMIRKHGDILNDGTIELQAREAAKNEEHAKVLMTAIKALGKKTGTKVNIDRGYLQVQAAKTIGAIGIKEIKPAKFYRAGIRSAERAAVALNEGRDEEALHYKIQHLANHYLYKEAIEAKASADKQWSFIKKAKKRKYDTKKVSPEYVTQIKGLVAAYEEADADIDAARESFMKIATWIDKQWSDQADAERPDVTDTTLGEMIAIMQRDDLAGAEKEKALGQVEIKTLDSLTVEELSGVYDMVRNLRYIGGRMSQANAEALTEIVRQAVNSMKTAKIGNKDKSPKATPSPADILGSDIKQVHYDQIALRQLVLEMDGWEYFGPVWNAFFQGIHDASMDELKLKRETHEKLTEMFGNFGKARLLGLKGPKELKRTWFKTNEDGRRGVVLENGEEWILSRRDRVMLALYWGSDYARDIILQNSKLPVTEPAVLEQLSFLSEDELNLVEEMWALNESFWPKVEATALAINGVAPPKVPHSPYVVNGREMPGGYMRIFYAEDPKDAKIPDRHNEAHLTMAGAHLAKNTKHGARVERVGSGGRELSLEMDNYFRAIEETIHDVTFAETARDSWRFLQHPEMVSAIYELYGKEHYRSMQGALTGMIAGGALDTDMFSKLLRYLRTNASLAYLGYSPRNFVQQPVAMANVINEIGEKYTAVGLAGFAGTPKEIKALKTLIQEKSEFMRYRPSVVNRETADIKNRLDSSALAGGYQRNAFWLQTKGDAAVAYPAWWGAYQQGLEKFGDEHRAVTYADETVAKTVGSGLLKDLPPLLQGVSEGRFKGRVELVKGFTFMMTFFNLIYQIQNETIKKNNLKTAEGISSATRSFFWVIAVQSLVSAALVLDLPDEGDDEGWAEWAAKSLASFSLSSVVFVRDIVSALTGFGLKTPYTKVVPATVSGAKKAGEILTNEEELSVENAAKLARTMGLMAPLPGSYALARMLEGIDHQERTGQGNIYSIAVEGKPR